ncbi:PKD domain-containing protein [Bacteroidota bacterium]
MKKIYLLTLIMVFSISAFGQLKQLTDTTFSKGEVERMFFIGNEVYSYGSTGGAFKSSDKGHTWTFIAANMDTLTNQIRDMIYFNNKLFALLDHYDGNIHLVSSPDKGQTWQQENNLTGLPTNRGYGVDGLGMVNSKAFLLVRIYDYYGWGVDSCYIYHSTNGVNWTKGALCGTNVWYMKAMHINKNKMYFGAEMNVGDSIMYTVDGTTVYGLTKTGLPDSYIRFEDMTGDYYGSSLYTGNSGSPYRFDSAQNKWISMRTSDIDANSMVDMVAGNDNVQFCFGFLIQGSNFIVETYRSKNKGVSWQKLPISSIFPPVPRYVVSVSDSELIMNTQLGEIITSTDTGYTWTGSLGYQNKVFSSITEINGNLVIPVDIFGVVRSSDNGQSWHYINNGLVAPIGGAYFTEETFKNQGVLYLTSQATMDEDSIVLYKSNNSGTTWTLHTAHPPFKSMYYYGESGNSFIMKFTNDRNGGDWWDTACFFYRTDNGGSSWVPISLNFFTSPGMNLASVNGFVGDGTNLYMLGYTKNNSSILYYSGNNGMSWTFTPSLSQYNQNFKTKRSWSRKQLPLAATDKKGKFMAVINSYGNQSIPKDSLYNLTPFGVSPASTTGLPDGLIMTNLDYVAGYWYLCTTTGIYASQNGSSWKTVDLSNYYLGMQVHHTVRNGDKLFLGTFGNGIWELDHKKVNLGKDIDVCLGNSVSITASAPDSNFSWCCGYGMNKTISFTPTFGQNLTASAIDIFGFTTKDTIGISISPSPVADFSIDDSIQCLAGNSFTFTGKSTISTGLMDYFWDFGDGNSASYNNKPNHSYTAYAPDYEVKLTNVSDLGCKDSMTKKVYFEIPPVAVITAAGDTAVCDGDSVSMYANTGANLGYQWYKDNVIINGATQPYYVTTTAGAYHTLVTNTISGCSGISNSITIVINSTNLNPNFTASPRTPGYNSSTQQFDPVAFTNLTLNPNNFNFSWIFGDGNTSMDSDPFYYYKYNGTYSVSLTAEHKTTGCRDTFSRTNYILCSGGSVNPCPISVEITYNGIPIICRNDSFLITATTVGNINSYLWTYEGTVLEFENGDHIYAKESGDYRVIVSDTNCSVSSLPFTLNNYPMVEPIIKSEGSIQPCSNDSIRLYNTTYYTNYMWSTGQTGNSIYVKKSGEYFLTVTDIHGCMTTSQAYSVNASMLQKPSICLVTVDTIIKKNLIAWERPQSNLIAGYVVYKEGFQANIYSDIGYVPYDSLSVFVDTNANPQQRSNRYKISLIDTCGIESAPSVRHKTIHLSANTGTSGENNLIWSHYEGFPFSSYKIYRGTKPTNLTLLDSVPSNLNSYSDLTPPSGLVFYQVNVVKYDTCFPAIIRAQTSKGPFSQSTSNLRDYSSSTTDYLEASPDKYTFDSLGGSQTFDIFTNLTTWTTSSDQTWLSLSNDIPNKQFQATATENTTYSSRQAIITVSGASVADFEIVITQGGRTVGLPEAGENTELFVYPNPFGNHFYLFMPGTSSQKKTVSILDLSGKVVFNQEYTGDELIKIDRNNLAHGMYFVRVNMDKTYMVKIVAY